LLRLRHPRSASAFATVKKQERMASARHAACSCRLKSTEGCWAAAPLGMAVGIAKAAHVARILAMDIMLMA
jgi:hypothetical protein